MRPPKMYMAAGFPSLYWQQAFMPAAEKDKGDDNNQEFAQYYISKMKLSK